jgi:zinc D-Ala-D-Ala dipeptidase
MNHKKKQRTSQWRIVVVGAAIAAWGAGAAGCCTGTQETDTRAKEEKTRLPEAQKHRPPWAVNLLEAGGLENLRWEPIYRRADNPASRRLYGKEAKPWTAPEVAEALARAARTLEAQGYGLTVVDAYRPLGASVELWNGSLRAGEPPNSYADPRKGSDHNRCAAIDVHLHRLDGTPGPEFPTQIGKKTPTGGAQGAMHKAKLGQALRAEGFQGHPSEWWHFSLPEARRRPLGDWEP